MVLIYIGFFITLFLEKLLKTKGTAGTKTIQDKTNQTTHKQKSALKQQACDTL